MMKLWMIYKKLFTYILKRNALWSIFPNLMSIDDAEL